MKQHKVTFLPDKKPGLCSMGSFGAGKSYFNAEREWIGNTSYRSLPDGAEEISKRSLRPRQV